jgi:8-oxo-dGTP pyrophosphatase MutT (NUDIX family)
MTVPASPPSPSARRAFSVAVFARHEGAVLLIHHARLRAWLPVGGEIEAGETPLEAAARELREETGLEGAFPAIAGAITGAPPGLLAYEEHLAGSKGLHMNFCFVADVPSRAVVSNGEFTAHRWVVVGEPLDAPENVRELVARIFAAEPRA